MVKLKPARYQKPSRSVVSKKKSILPRLRTRIPARTSSRISIQNRFSKAPKKKSFGGKLTGFLIGLGLILFLLFIALFILYKNILSAALNKAEPELMVLAPQQVEDTEDSILFAYIGKEMKNSFIVALPGKTDVVVPGGYGHYRVSSVYPLLQLDKKDDHEITASYSRIAGRVIDRTYGSPEISLEEKATTLPSHPILQLAIDQFVQTHEIPYELIKFWYFSRQGLSVTQVSSLPELQQFLAQKKVDVPAAQECPVGILNATSQPGVAQTMSTMVEQSGLVAIRTSSFPEIQPTTTIYYNDNGETTCQPILQMLKMAFLNEPKIEKNEAMTTEYRAPLVVVLGNDFQ